jgi:hypothetical protein
MQAPDDPLRADVEIGTFARPLLLNPRDPVELLFHVFYYSFHGSYNNFHGS